MGYLITREGGNGRKRHTAMYRDIRGRLCSAGTFAKEKDANRAWQAAEVKTSEGRMGDPRRGRQTFRRYYEDQWMPHHVVEISTRQGYTYQIKKHILAWFGPMKMNEILPSHVREWVTAMINSGVRPKTLANLRNMLSAVFTTALNDQIIFIHPCKGVKTPTVPTRPLTILTPEQFDAIYAKLPNSDTQLLIETEIETGLRWGELTELRIKDLDTATRVFTVSRAVVQVDPQFHPDGERFFVKEYPKDKQWRRVKVSQQLTDKIANHIAAESLADDDLLFAIRFDEPNEPHLRVVPDPDTLGRTEPNANGRTYKHGTLSGYNAGKCRCRHCTDAFAIYRAARRAASKDAPRSGRRRVVATDGHIPRDWFRTQVWIPARDAAKLKVKATVRDLRHAHASWLLAGGADLQVGKDRVGHARIATTEKYLHTLPDADDSALDAFNAIRNRSRRTG